MILLYGFRRLGFYTVLFGFLIVGENRLFIGEDSFIDKTQFLSKVSNNSNGKNGNLYNGSRYNIRTRKGFLGGEVD